MDDFGLFFTTLSTVSMKIWLFDNRNSIIEDKPNQNFQKLNSHSARNVELQKETSILSDFIFFLVTRSNL